MKCEDVRLMVICTVFRSLRAEGDPAEMKRQIEGKKVWEDTRSEKKRVTMPLKNMNVVNGLLMIAIVMGALSLTGCVTSDISNEESLTGDGSQSHGNNESASFPHKVVYGFWPYRVDPQTYQPDWDSLTHVAYTPLKVNADGSLDTRHIGTDYYCIRDTARAHDVEIIVTIYCSNQSLLDNVLAYHRHALVTNILQNLQFYGADGVCIDFERVRSVNAHTGESNTALMEQFLHILYATVKSANPNYHIAFCVGGGVGSVYHNVNLGQYTDAVFFMGYDYHYHKSPTTGAVSPFNDPTQLDVIDSVAILENYYPAHEIILGLPFYGYEWPSESDSPGTSTIGTGTAVRMEDAIANAQIYGRLWDANAHTPWYRYQSNSTWHQCWYEDEESLGLKLDYVNSTNLAGVGIWALGYEGNDAEIWGVIRDKLGIIDTGSGASHIS
jgi:GH18 family chitinase